MSFWYLRPDESFMFGSVTGTVAADYNANWLVDGLPGRPVRGETSLALTATALASRSVSLISVVNHNIVGSIAISGGVTATVPAATVDGDGVPRNTFVSVTPVAATSLVMSVTQTPSIVGELIAGTKRTLGRQLRTEAAFDPGEPFEWEGELSSLAPYDPGVSARRLTGDTLVDDVGLADILAWYQSTRNGTRPTLIVPIDTINDAWLVTFRYHYQTVLIHPTTPTRSIHRVFFEFTEIPRVRW